LRGLAPGHIFFRPDTGQLVWVFCERPDSPLAAVTGTAGSSIATANKLYSNVCDVSGVGEAARKPVSGVFRDFLKLKFDSEREIVDPMAKRQRYATRPFEQGVNPPPGSSWVSKRRKALSENPSQANITPMQGTAEALTPLTLPAMLALAQDSPVFEPSCTQSTIDTQADDIVGNNDEDRSDIEAPKRNNKARTGVADAIGGTRDAQIGVENAVLAPGGAPATPA
jgi:hypothetical protein